MMETQRLILYVALGLVLLLLWQSWIQYNTPTAPPAATGTAATAGNMAAPDATIPAAPQAPSAPTTVNAAEGLGDESAGRKIVVETDLIRAEISTIGADLRKFELLDYPVDIAHPDVPLALMTDSGPDIYLSETGLLGRGHEYPNHKTEWRVDGDRFALGGNADAVEVHFTYDAGGGLVYHKTYRFHRDSYLVDIEYQVDNGSAAPWSGYRYAQFVRTEVVSKSSFGFLGQLPSYTGGAIYTPEDHLKKIKFSDMRDADLARQVDSGWVSMMEHYFVGAWLPGDQGPFEFYSSVAGSGAQPLYRIGYKTLSPVEVASGASGTLHDRLYIGPTEQVRLKRAADGLVLTVDYGWLTAIASPLFWLMKWIHTVFGNWGWSIIFLTVLVKLVFFPLSAASYRSMAKMKNLQPRLKTLKERYGEDRQKFQQEMMKIYKEEKINPLGGCLPIVIQIPVFIALYWVLLESVELRQASWFWINDLSVKDPFYILPVLMGASMLVQQRLNPAPMDDMQKKVMMALPFVFTVFFLFFPAGLVLYWVTNNVLSITQQWVITNKLQAKH